MNKKDCVEYDSCMEAAKVSKADGDHCTMTRDSNLEFDNELVLNLHCEACSHYKTVGDA